MKKLVIALTLSCALLIVLVFTFLSLPIDNPKPEECVVQTERIIKISEGTSSDIVFSAIGGDHYYINRGKERGLNLEDLNATVLNKTVTLHLPKLLGGSIISEHIAQIAIGDNIIFTEFPSTAEALEDN